MSVTEEVSHVFRGWLKLIVERNKSIIVVTEDVSHWSNGWLYALPQNTPYSEVAEDVSQSFRGWLKAVHM